jgi:hypothetical protein
LDPYVPAALGAAPLQVEAAQLCEVHQAALAALRASQERDCRADQPVHADERLLQEEQSVGSQQVQHDCSEDCKGWPRDAFCTRWMLRAHRNRDRVAVLEEAHCPLVQVEVHRDVRRGVLGCDAVCAGVCRGHQLVVGVRWRAGGRSSCKPQIVSKLPAALVHNVQTLLCCMHAPAWLLA